MKGKNENSSAAAAGPLSAESFLPFVRYVAQRFAGRGMPQDELFQYGSLGLWKAWLKYDAERNVPFASFAFIYIEGEIRTALRKNSAFSCRMTVDSLEERTEICIPVDADDDEAKVLRNLQLREGLETLSETEKAVICLRYFRGLTQKKTAAVLRVSQPTVSKTEKNALKKLKNKFCQNDQIE